MTSTRKSARSDFVDKPKDFLKDLKSQTSLQKAGKYITGAPSQKQKRFKEVF